MQDVISTLEMKAAQGYSIDLELTKRVWERDQPSFLPWIGKDYRTAEKRVLVVGLSHYQNPKSEPWMQTLKTPFPNIETIHGNGMIKIASQRTSKFHRGTERVFTGLGSDQIYNDFGDMRDAFWSEKAFTQLIQVPMSSSNHNKRIEKENIERDFARLVSLIEFIQPNHVVLMTIQKEYAKRFFALDGMKCSEEVVKALPKGKSKLATYLMQFQKEGIDLSIKVTSLRHPSRQVYIKEQYQYLKEVGIVD